MDLTETLLERRTVYQGRYLRAEERRVRLPDGKEAMREIISPPNAVGVLPIDEAGRVYFVKQYRPAIEQVTLEIPAGILEEGETTAETASRECAEEIGFEPKQLEHLFMYHHSVGFSTGKIDIFLGRDLRGLSKQNLDPGEFIEVVILPFDEAFHLTTTGKIIDSKTLLALLWFKQHFLT